MSSGVTPSGFAIKALADIQADLEDAFRAAFGAEIDLQPEGPFGQIIGIMAERLSEGWQLAQAVYASEYPDSATGASLDNVAAITGTLRLPATRSTVTEVLVGTTGTVVPAGRIIQVVNAGAQFTTLADVTLAAVSGRALTHAYAVGDLVRMDGNVYVVTVAGTTDGSTYAGGHWTALTGNDYTDSGGQVHYCYVGTSTGGALAACEAVDTGPKVAPAFTCTDIQTPVAGLVAAKNYLDAAPGRDLETDAALRVRRELELQAQGNASVDAIRARVLEVSGVTSCTVFENATDTTDGDGVPPHAIEVLVLGGADQAILDAVWAAKAAGIATYGSTTGAVTDSAGVAHTVKFSRPTQVNIYVDVALTKTSAYPATGDAQVKAALVAWALGTLLDEAGVPLFPGYGVGDDVVTSRLYVPIETVAGVYDVTHIYIGTAPSPGSSANVTTTSRQLAVFDTSRITVTAT